ncbi:hypothetical protein E2C01_089150 [Portunus trituberculatus]|uniref:Uncharacterized protein n=1 Tax=Portunus trituberculatus TaxID=210409 RepID=A0A5B7JB65_PORTR|nr:hypothetical protein [Portunus trituberculatus]
MMQCLHHQGLMPASDPTTHHLTMTCLPLLSSPS